MDRLILSFWVCIFTSKKKEEKAVKAFVSNMSALDYDYFKKILRLCFIVYEIVWFNDQINDT